MLFLDRETLHYDVIDLVLRVSDVGNHSSEAVVTITIHDVNDNAPIFENSSILVWILECAQSGRVAARVAASDSDQGENGRIMYRIKAGSYGKFAINSHTGKLVD